ncbi:MAG TPA: GAF domain-containing sensor histidine kinase [Gemmatimonadaceae bacterium]|nr:GAF domain-containing sensor histidine kinase [Gemmatimonadaceae bacterium]
MAPVSVIKRLKELETVTAPLISEVSLQGVLQRVVQVSTEVIGARHAGVVVADLDGTVVESCTSSGIDPELAASVADAMRDRGILGRALREAKPVRLPDPTAVRAASARPAPQHLLVHGFLGVPIFGSRGVSGTLYLTEKTGGATFTDEDEDIAILLAAKTAAAIENARHHEESARLLAEVQQLHRTRERFFAMVNHELRNALAGVFGWAEMLVRKRDPAQVPRAAFEVLDSAQHAIALIDDLLDLSRLDEDRLKPNIKPVEPLAIASRAVRRVTPPANLKQVTLRVSAAPNLPNCETDANRVEQILINLLSNAIKYSPERSEVRIDIASKGSRVLYRIEDAGPGVAASDVEHIFDIYVTKAGEESRGLGLGLPLSRRLARLLGGELYAVGRAEKGGQFILEVPASIS